MSTAAWRQDQGRFRTEWKDPNLPLTGEPEFPGNKLGRSRALRYSDVSCDELRPVRRAPVRPSHAVDLFCNLIEHVLGDTQPRVPCDAEVILAEEVANLIGRVRGS